MCRFIGTRAENAIRNPMKTKMAFEVLATKKARLEPMPVLPERFVRPVQRTTVQIATVVDKKCTSSIVKSLSEQFPLKELQHLKRVRNNGNVLEVILCHDAKDLGAASAVVKQGLDLGTIRKHEVSLHTPLTREQFDECLKMWPTQFHEDRFTKSILDGTIFSASDREQMRKCMQIVVDRARDEQSIMVSSPTSCGAAEMTFNVAAIVNPRNGLVLAVGVDRRHVHPALHATMAAIDLVAALQGGGAWGTERLLGVREVPNNDQMLKSCDHSATGEDGDSTKTPYICTGYDVYLLREPCTMCAMALVHSRVRRAFYGCSDKVRGALGSRFSVHCLGDLNHSFHVWKNVLREECYVGDTVQNSTVSIHGRLRLYY
ncbi:probable inactive tRNA-specific adenosine deaminase-like protein 3 isoform X1 [Varroa destructor]|uniref:CMP/dCMP-type deaminase domain-containing protein n=2 Tax=Varroa destructor TaxID=109461 RepID=A0A7M7MJY9_VARDE|nr:probable inactive tRNA-specific adenosine deaminase-like protein 3 isoform X1 [Varroa destructor]